jgi:hypothetical protein
MQDVLEELTGDKLSQAHVEERLADWDRRIRDLYDQIGTWLPKDWTVASTRRTGMHEEPMREVGLPPRELPILDVFKGPERVATIEPRVLWIIGANGRLDLRKDASHFLIFDFAKLFEQPRWEVTRFDDRRHQVAFNAASFRNILASP